MNGSAPLQPARAVQRRCTPGGHGAQRGYTLVELIIVMVLMGILAAVAGPRFASTSVFAGAAAVESTLATLRMAHSTAIARRATVHVQINGAAGRITLCNDAGCASPLTPPGGETAWLQLAGSLQFANSATYSIASDGRPSLASALVVQVTDASAAPAGSAVQVEPETGHVRKL